MGFFDWIKHLSTTRSIAFAVIFGGATTIAIGIFGYYWLEGRRNRAKQHRIVDASQNNNQQQNNNLKIKQSNSVNNNTNNNDKPKKSLLKRSTILCCGNEIILEAHKTQDGSKDFALVGNNVCESISSFLYEKNDFYLVFVVHNDIEETKIRNCLETTNFWNESGMDPRKLLFCETDEGKAHMARQLGASCFIDKSIPILEMLKPFVKQLILINPEIGKQTTTTTTTNFFQQFASLSEVS